MGRRLGFLTLDQAYLPPALLSPNLRRRPASERTATWPKVPA
jgi:hypothetical protein